MSMRDSPLVTDEVEADMFTASAESRLAAISNDVRVRVEDSKKKLMTVFPRSVGTFFIARLETSLKESAVSRMVLISSTDSSLIPSRSFRLYVNLARIRSGRACPCPNSRKAVIYVIYR